MWVSVTFFLAGCGGVGECDPFWANFGWVWVSAIFFMMGVGGCG